MYFHTNLLKRAVIKAGDYALSLQIKNETKNNLQENNYLSEKKAFSEIDGEVQKIIIKYFIDIFPVKIGLIAEEKTDYNISDRISHFDKFHDYKYTLVVDPIDGTKNYNNGKKFWGTSICLFYGNEPILGIIYYPAFDIILEVEKDKGIKINNELIKINNNIEHDNYHLIRLSGSLGDKKEKLKKIFPDDPINYGSLVFTFLSMLSDNSNNNFYNKKGYKSYIGGNSAIWDLGCCHLAWKEAGGVVTNWEGIHVNPFSEIDYINMKQKIPFIMAPNIDYAKKLAQFLELNKDDVLPD